MKHRSGIHVALSTLIAIEELFDLDRGIELDDGTYYSNLDISRVTGVSYKQTGRDTIYLHTIGLLDMATKHYANGVTGRYYEISDEGHRQLELYEDELNNIKDDMLKLKKSKVTLRTILK